jgi:hypothetical protein
MPHVAFKILAIAFVAGFTGLGLILVLQPSLYFRWFPNPFMADTPWNRIQMRELGLVLCLFALMVLSGLLQAALKSDFAEGFHNNIVLALWITFILVWVGGLLSWILWRFSAIRASVSNYFTNERLESPAWERRASLAFCSALLTILGAALFLAAIGFHV